MDARPLGTDGPVVSVLGLGCNNFGTRLDEAASRAVVHAALDAGITHFDTAASYGEGRSETFLGAALGSHRDEVVLATKFGGREHRGEDGPGAAANVLRACEASLARLGTDRIDVFYLHFPDRSTPVEETLEALAQLVRDGKVRHIAASNTTPDDIRELTATAGTHGHLRLAACQLEWNLLRRDAEQELVPVCDELGVGVVPYFPLASGLLTGKYRRGEDFPPDSRFAAWAGMADRASDEDFAAVERLADLAGGWKRPLVELAIAWLLSRREVASVIAGATRPDQIAVNTGGASWRLSETELAAVAGALAPQP